MGRGLQVGTYQPRVNSRAPVRGWTPIKSNRPYTGVPRNALSHLRKTRISHLSPSHSFVLPLSLFISPSLPPPFSLSPFAQFQLIGGSLRTDLWSKARFSLNAVTNHSPIARIAIFGAQWSIRFITSTKCFNRDFISKIPRVTEKLSWLVAKNKTRISICNVANFSSHFICLFYF